jgi:hypothetical protein
MELINFKQIPTMAALIKAHTNITRSKTCLWNQIMIYWSVIQ